MSCIVKPFDFLGIVGYPNNILEDVVDNVIEFNNGGDACAHIKAFWQLIDDWNTHPYMRMLLCDCFLGLCCRPNTHLQT
jgi:hypothetical protein